MLGQLPLTATLHFKINVDTCFWNIFEKANTGLPLAKLGPLLSFQGGRYGSNTSFNLKKKNHSEKQREHPSLHDYKIPLDEILSFLILT